MKLAVTTVEEVRPVERFGQTGKLFLMPVNDDMVDVCIAHENNNGYSVLVTISATHGAYNHKNVPRSSGLVLNDYAQLKFLSTDFSATPRKAIAEEAAKAAAAPSK